LIHLTKGINELEVFAIFKISGQEPDPGAGKPNFLLGARVGQKIYREPGLF
jgi:hypothetical protein